MGMKWNSRFKKKKREDWISAKHGPLGRRAKERQRGEGEEERERKMQGVKERENGNKTSVKKL